MPDQDEKSDAAPKPIESQFLVHGRDGPYLMEKAKWPVLTLLDENEPVEVLTQEDSSLKGKSLNNTFVFG